MGHGLSGLVVNEMKGESTEWRCVYVSESSKDHRSPGQEELFVAGSHDGARRAATFYALFATCKLNDVISASMVAGLAHAYPGASGESTQ
jgi:hypothetical protein